MSKKSSNDLHDADTAVADFLDILLQEATEPAEQPPVAEPARVLLMPDIELTPAALESEPEPEPVTRVEVVDSAPTAEQDTALQPTVDDADAEIDVKSIYQFPLQCLMFTVGDNRLSIPLIDLGSVLPWKDRLTQLPDTPDWFLGILQHREDKVKVVDTARILHISTSSIEPEQGHLLVFGDENWAISCDKLGEVRNLEHDDVQWSAAQSGGLALGTIRDSLAVLLDPKKILRLINDR